jgi:hypothetical protein
MAAYLLDEVDVLVTSNVHDFPIEDYETILTPREFVETFGSDEWVIGRGSAASRCVLLCPDRARRIAFGR